MNSAIREHTRTQRYNHWLNAGFAQQMSFNEYLERLKQQERGEKETAKDILDRIADIG